MSGFPTLRYATFTGCVACTRSIQTAIAKTIWTATCLLLFSIPSSAWAIDIVIQPGDGENPWYDDDGSSLWTIFATAAAIWEDYLPEEGETGTYEVDVFWSSSEFADDPALARWYYQAGGNNNIYVNPDPITDNGGAMDWYIDLTPTNHSEFDFETPNRFWSTRTNRYEYRGGTWHYGDVDPDEQSAWFGGSPPALMEIGYRGYTTVPAIEDQFDLLSIALHELGHELGVNDSGGPWTADPAWLAGGSATLYENAEEGHLAARTPLMCDACGIRGSRHLPSAIDIMASAVDEVMSTIDLPRQDYIGDGTWHGASRWLGGTPPDSADDAYLRSHNIVSVTANARVENLWLYNSSDLQVESGNTLRVDHHTTIDDNTSRLFVSPGAEAMLGELAIVYGDIVIDDGLVEVAGDLLTSDGGVLGGSISAYGGTVKVGGVFINGGAIVAIDDTTTFTYDGSPADKLDLDGLMQNGVVKASFGNLIFDARLTDAFDGEMEIHDGQFITMIYDWVLGTDGFLKLAGTSSDHAFLINAGTTTVKGAVHAGVGVISANQTWFEASAIVRVDHAEDRLILNTTTYFRGGTYVGAGAIEQQGDVHVWETTEIDAGEYDWGNSTVADPHDTHVNEGVTFTINAATTGTSRNEYRGAIYVSGGTLAVNLETGWLLPSGSPDDGKPAGELIFVHGDADTPRVTGAPLTVEGVVRAYGGLALMEADFITGFTASVTAVAGAELLLQGHNTYGGGAFVGDGEISQWGNTDVVFDTTIGTKYYDLDGDEANPSMTTIQRGVTFTINSDRIDKPGQSFHGTVVNDGGTLAVNTPSSWTVEQGGTVHLMNNGGPAFVTGAMIVADGTIMTTGGNEIFAPVTFRSTAVVSAAQPTDILRLRGHTNYEGGSYTGEGGIMQDAMAIISQPTNMHLGFFDMDGTQENSSIELRADFTLNVDRLDLHDNRFHGSLEVTNTARLTVNTSTPWSMAGSLEIAGAAGTRLTIGGAPVILENDVLVQPFNELAFAADASGPGNFSGGGDVSFFGKYSPGGSPAMVTGDGDITFTDSAQLLIELGGTTAVTAYDVLRFQGNAFLDGRLEVALIDLDGGVNPFVPLKGDTFRILIANSGVNDEFASHQLPFVGPSVRWEVLYDNAGLTLRVVESDLSADLNRDRLMDCADVNELVAEIGGGEHHAAFDLNGDTVVDYNDLTWWLAEAGWHNLPSKNPYPLGDATLDGVVDVSDFNIWNANKFSASTVIPGWCQGNFNADDTVDFLDFLIWNANKFSSSDAVTVVPEPAGWSLALGALLLWAMCRVHKPSDL